MSKKNNKPRRKRPNPAFSGSFMEMDELTKFVARSTGPMILAQAIPDATLPEIAVLASILPMALKILRSGGKDSAEQAFSKLYPEGVEITIGPTSANANSAAHSDSPEAKTK